uniref:Uncharacterized protein n=1 Tax=Ananas comosus var. bracteatus TaxID=296719 RepID=A0A6V7NW69_ANACO|nr:unnamed protein product [Ananas comosus var. bracteatus]
MARIPRIEVLKLSAEVSKVKIVGCSRFADCLFWEGVFAIAAYLYITLQPIEALLSLDPWRIEVGFEGSCSLWEIKRDFHHYRHDDIGLELDTYACSPLCSFAHTCEGRSLQAGTPEIAIATYARPCGIGRRNGMPWGRLVLRVEMLTTTGPLGKVQAGPPTASAASASYWSLPGEGARGAELAAEERGEDGEEVRELGGGHYHDVLEHLPDLADMGLGDLGHKADARLDAANGQAACADHLRGA